MDDAFGWSTQYAAEPCLPSRPSDDDGLLSAFLVHCHDGTGLSESLPAPAFMGLDTAADMLPSVTAGAAMDGGLLLDAFAYVPNVVAEGTTAQATVSNSNTVFSGYSSTTAGNGGGNISSGESNSNTCGSGGGQDVEVASPCAAVSRPTLLHHQTSTLHPSNKRRHPASCASAKSSSSSTSITFGGRSRHQHQDAEAMAQVKEMIYRAATMRPVHQLVRAAAGADLSQQDKRRRRKNVRISSDPQTVAARLRRERVSERLRVLQRLVPGGSRMDTASMLDEAASYLRFLKSQLQALESAGGNPSDGGGYCNGSSSLLQNYCMGNDLGGGGTNNGGGSTVLAFGSRDGIGGYVKSNRTMPL